MPLLVLRLLALKSWLSSRTKNLTSNPWRVGIFAFIAAILFRATPAHAAPLWVDQMAQGFAYYAYALAAAITQGIVLLIDVMVPIMTYDNFVGNPVVKAGWAIVRDTVNMFFVVILIIIAFGTIFGNERFKWQQQVPRLLTMAIVINFSKTLCGIMIDFGQVIMLQFANALREIAAGNFIQLLGLNQIYQVSQASSIVSGVADVSAQGASQAFDFFGSAILSVLLVLWVFATLVIMVVILLFRIVMLWMLVVMAPLAWFMKGASGIIQSNAYSDWWNEFKCLVGIGPILAFFLWLTLAVAGAGNIAANSGFDVNADSNNADLTGSLFEVNNFLSFLIGMAMLFAGLKAAAQFCSAGISGGFIGNRLKSAQAFSPEKVAKLAAGAGLKVGGYGARLTGRGLASTPGAAAAASRYLPPSVRNIPNQINPLNASRRAALAGVVGGALGDNAAGRWFKGRQADLELGIRADQFSGVNKEKEAMKDKSRDWKKGQIESMLKSPPRTQAGQDAMTALFEEAMADSRLQKELGPDGMKKLWDSQGKKYTDMSKGNTAKEADLNGFRKKYAHVTGAVDELQDVDDMKGLASDAWTDEAVRERAKGVSTTFEKGKDKDGKKIFMNALEAAQAGLLGNKDTKEAAKSVARIDSASIDENSFDIALRNGDRDTAQQVMQRMESKYTAPTTSNEDRAKMARSMDRMQAAAAQMGRGGNGSAQDILASFQTKRKGMETKSGFGLPPALKAGEGADEYVDTHFAQASGERIDSAINDIDTQKSAGQGAVTALEAEVQALRGVEKQVADKQQQISDVRRRIQQSIEQDRRNAYQPLRRARKNIATAQQKGNADEIARAQSAVTDAQAAYDRVTKEGDEELKNSPDITALEAQTKQIIEAAGGQTKLKEVEEKARRLRDLEEQANRLESTKNRLQQERAKRP